MIARGLILLLSLIYIGCGHPSDKVLEERFRTNRQYFQELGEMLTADQDLVVLNAGNIFYEPNATAISAERLTLYRDLLRKLNLESINRDNKFSVNMIASYRGFPIQSSGKGYYFSTRKVSPIVESLDAVIWSDGGDTKPTFKLLEGNWYLVYESW